MKHIEPERHAHTKDEAMIEAIEVTLKIENSYADGSCITIITTAEVTPPPVANSDDMEEWEQEQIFPLTGTGRVDGMDAGYFVEVLESSCPDLLPVGTKYEYI